MDIKWLGHACFKIISDDDSLVIDPFENGSVPGLKNINEEADLVLCSHEHFDHNARSTVKLSNKANTCFKIETIRTYHDDRKGALRGTNTIYIISDGTFKIAHLGDLGCNLDYTQKERLKNLDAILVPIGGTYTIDSKQAFLLVNELKPKVVIPMHFKSNTFGFDVLEDLHSFKSQFTKFFNVDGNTLTLKKEDCLKGLAILKY